MAIDREKEEIRNHGALLQKKYINEFVSKMVPDELHLTGLQKLMRSIFDNHRSPYSLLRKLMGQIHNFID